ncbi:MAG: ATP-binding protein [Candidatus Aerophobus sp.]|nr:MAG: ATP-binding protein [Candidatus Aerophobus sp.]
MENQASSITLEASLENLKAVNSFICKWAKRASLSPRNENNLLLAVEEVYVNIVKYAYPESLGKITIYCHMDENSLVSKIKDAGIPFNPLKAPEPLLASCLGERKIGGLGLFLIQKLVDNVEYEREGKYNVLTLVSSRKRKVKRQESEENSGK